MCHVFEEKQGEAEFLWTQHFGRSCVVTQMSTGAGILV